MNFIPGNANMLDELVSLWQPLNKAYCKNFSIFFPNHLLIAYMYLLSSDLGWGVIRSDQIRSVAQSCPTLCDPMNRSTPGLPVHHQLPEFTQTLVHPVSYAIQPSHPLSSPSPPAPNPHLVIFKIQLRVTFSLSPKHFSYQKPPPI